MSKGGHLLPICTLHLLGESVPPNPPRRALVEALVDTGALCSVFPRKAAEDAGIELPLGYNYHIKYGAGQLVPAWRRWVDIEVDGKRFKAPVAFVERLAFTFALLGRDGVFVRFREVSFMEHVSYKAMQFRP
jgi:hypothetical protein